MTAGPLRVETHAADLGACGHYRLIWPAAVLARDADPATLTIRPLGPGDEAESFHAQASLPKTAAALGYAAGPAGIEQLLAAIRAGEVEPGDMVIDRITNLPDDIDVVVLQRPLTGHLVQAIEVLQAAGIAVVVETDDDFETIHRENIAHGLTTAVDRHRNYLHLQRAAELADLVVVTTPALARRYGRHGRVAVIPNYVPARYVQVLPPHREPATADAIRVGWSGSLDTHPGDLEETRGAVGSALARRRLPFFHVGAPDPDRMTRALSLDPAAGYASTGGWLPLAQYPAGMAMLDVGIVPLAPGPFNEAKSWLKGLEFAAVGVPFVASPTGPYVELHERYGLGRLAKTRRDWSRELGRLIDDADWRWDLARAGRATVIRELTIERNAHQWADAWRQARDNRKART